MSLVLVKNKTFDQLMRRNESVYYCGSTENPEQRRASHQTNGRYGTMLCARVPNMTRESELHNKHRRNRIYTATRMDGRYGSGYVYVIVSGAARGAVRGVVRGRVASSGCARCRVHKCHAYKDSDNLLCTAPSQRKFCGRHEGWTGRRKNCS